MLSVFGQIARIINGECRHCGRPYSVKCHGGQTDLADSYGMAGEYQLHTWTLAFGQRQPRPGATCFKIASMTWAL
jgi:hypothetical protein